MTQRAQGLMLSMQRYTVAGTTSIYEGHGIDPDLMLAYKHLWTEGAMTVRSHLLFTPPSKSAPEFREQLEDLAQLASGGGIGDEWLRVGGICFQLSGNRTVAELRRRAKPYTRRAGHYHDPVTPAQLRELVVIAAQNDLRVCVLADQIPNVDAILTAFEDADRRVGIHDKRYVIQHLQFATPRQLDRMEEGKKGSIEPGKWADLVVLEDDLLTLPEDRIKDLASRLTIVGGRLVYETSSTPHR